jgi:hypothetical protein
MSRRIRIFMRQNVLGLVAIFIALSGTAYATHPGGANTISSGDIMDGQVYSADVRNDTLSGGGLTAADLRTGSVGASEVSNGSLGAADLASGSVGTDEVAADSLAAGDLASSSIGADEVADGSLTGAEVLNGSLGTAELGAIPGARATNTTNQTIAEATPTVISLGTEGFDTANLHDTTTNNSRLTAPVAGAYQINARVRWESGAAGVRTLRIEKNLGSPGAKTIAEEMSTASAPDRMTQNVSTISRLIAGEYVELRVIQSSTGTSVDTLAAPGIAPELSMAWVAP